VGRTAQADRLRLILQGYSPRAKDRLHAGLFLPAGFVLPMPGQILYYASFSRPTPDVALTMDIDFSPQPGPRERHLRRKYRNPLFPDTDQIDAGQVRQAREQDEAELDHFLRYFRGLVQEAVDLQPNSDSDVILDIKERLDQCYVQCCALPGDHNEIKQAVNRLVQVIMAAVRQGAANDPIALNKLDEEDQARQLHNRLADEVFVADLILPDSPIGQAELVASLLSESQQAVAAALQLFDVEQLSSIYQQARELVAQTAQQGHALPEAQQRLKQIEAVLAVATSQVTIN